MYRDDIENHAFRVWGAAAVRRACLGATVSTIRRMATTTSPMPLPARCCWEDDRRVIVGLRSRKKAGEPHLRLHAIGD